MIKFHFYLTLHSIIQKALNCIAQVVSAAHAVILASGTLSPVEAVSQQLIPGLAAAGRLRHFSCGHVVAKERLLALAIGQCRKFFLPSGIMRCFFCELVQDFIRACRQGQRGIRGMGGGGRGGSEMKL